MDSNDKQRIFMTVSQAASIVHIARAHSGKVSAAAWEIFEADDHEDHAIFLDSRHLGYVRFRVSKKLNAVEITVMDWHEIEATLITNVQNARQVYQRVRDEIAKA